MAERTFPGRKLPQFVAAVSAAFGGFTSGNVIGWMSPCGPLITEQLEEDQGKPEKEFDTTTKELSSLVSGIMNLGACLGLFIVIWTVDRAGRKWTMIGTMPLMIVGYVILAFVPGWYGWLIGRFVTGMCAGVFCAVSPTYICEVTQKQIRGVLGISFQLNIVLGILLSFLLAYVGSIRWITIILIGPAALFLAIIIFMPETPYFLLAKGKDEQAMKSLQWLRGKKTDVEEEFIFIKGEVSDQLQQKGTFVDLFKNKPTCLALGTCMILMFGQQLSGINAVMFYMQKIFEIANEKDSIRAAVIVGVVQVVATLIAACVVDLAGRRIMLFLSFAIMILCLASLGGYFFGDFIGSSMEKHSWVPITSLCLYIFGFSLGAGPVPWAMLGEILPGEVRGVAACFCGITNWLLSFIVTKTYPNMKDALGAHWAFWVYALVTGGFLVLILFYVVETKKRTFTEIREVYEGKAPERAPLGLKKRKA